MKKGSLSYEAIQSMLLEKMQESIAEGGDK